MTREIYTPPKGPPTGPKPSNDIYESMKKEGIFSMLADVYRMLGKSEIKHMFPATEDDLVASSEKSAAFFVQITGGPDIYTQQFGAPQMRKRHLPFIIDKNARNHWLACFYSVLEDAPDKYQFPKDHLRDFKSWLAEFSAWMVNTQS